MSDHENNIGHVQSGRRPQTTPEMQEVQKKHATAQLANQIFMALACEQNKAIEWNAPKDLVDRSFALAEAFDRKLEEYLKPSPIVSAPPGLKLS